MWQIENDYISTEGFLFKASERISLTIERVLEMKNSNLFKMFFDIQMVKLSVFVVRDFSRRNGKKKQYPDNDSEHCFCLSIPSENLYSAASKKHGIYLQTMV